METGTASLRDESAVNSGQWTEKVLKPKSPLPFRKRGDSLNATQYESSGGVPFNHFIRVHPWFKSKSLKKTGPDMVSKLPCRAAANYVN
jgi:hypothetical protein